MNLLILGCGSLGSEILSINSQQKKFTATGVTLGTKRHTALATLSARPAIIASPWDAERFDGCIIALTPGSREFPETLRRAARCVTGRVVLISSSSVYQESSGKEITDEAATNPANTELLLREDLVQQAFKESVILRSAGIYSKNRGPHNFYLSSGTVRGNPEGWINLIHENDLARLALTLLSTQQQTPKILMASDGNPIQRKTLAGLATTHAPEFGHSARELTWTDTASSDLGKRLKPWLLKHPHLFDPAVRSFKLFCEQLGGAPVTPCP